MSSINRAGLGILLSAIMATIATGLKVGPAEGIALSISVLIGFVLLISERE